MSCKKSKDIIIPDGMKWCPGEIHGDDPMNHILPLDSFHKRAGSKIDGRQPRCKLCKKQYDHDNYQKNPSSFVQRNKKQRNQRTLLSIEMKKDLKCVSCGFGDDDHHMCLVFHHVKPSEKLFDISNAMRNMVAIDKIEKEIEKTVVLCSNCHSIISYFYTQYYHKKITKKELYMNLEMYDLQDFLIV